MLAGVCISLVGCAEFIRGQFFRGEACDDGTSGDEMVRVGGICVDKYEASVWNAREGGEPLGSDKPIPCSPNGAECRNKIFARSVRGAMPAVSITWFQASMACANVNKRLLSNAQWQQSALGTSDDPAVCNTKGPARRPTGTSACISSTGVYDMVGNVSEWVADWTQANSRNDGGEISTSEYGSDRIAGIDEAAPESFRFPSALIRGGSWRDDSGAGVYALDALNSPTRAREWLGFRCAR
jgi:formylglycine-generating enzyme required for sulfatase activity